MAKNGRQEQRSPFEMFGGFADSIFRKNPFFTRPSATMFGPSGESHPVISPVAPTITLLDSDDDGDDMEIEGDELPNPARRLTEPFVDHPDDDTSDDDKQTSNRTDYNTTGGTQAQSFKVHTCKVSYGGVDGVYYSSSATRKVGSDGMIVEECKEADKSKGEATHRISRGLHDKGHSVTKKLNSDGKVDSLQTLHNLNEDELENFEEAWRSNTAYHLPSWAGSGVSGMARTSDWGRSLVPSISHMRDAQGTSHNNQARTDNAGGRPRKVVRIPID